MLTSSSLAVKAGVGAGVATTTVSHSTTKREEHKRLPIAHDVSGNENGNGLGTVDLNVLSR